MPRRALTLALCLAILAAKPTESPARQHDWASLDAVVLAELEEKKTPGAAVAVVSNGRVVYAKAFGVASTETNEPTTTSMLFRLGSTTKMFNGLALAALARDGKIDLDAPISRYVKGLDPAVGRVTASQLLSHTAGFRDFAAPAVSNDESSFAPAIKSFTSDVFFTEPGAIHSYSSAGYWLAGVVIEEVSGKAYADAIAELVFRPLGMVRSTFRPLEAMTYPVAVGHAPAADGAPAVVRPAANNTVMWPGGSIYSSADELARFAVAFLEGAPPLGAEVYGLVSRPHVVMPGSDGKAFYGYGLVGYEDRGVRMLLHGGFSRGYGSMIVFAPAHRFAVVVVTNRSGQTLPKTVERAASLLLPFAAQPETTAPRRTPPTAVELAAYAGVYEHAPSRWEVATRDGKLYVASDGKESELTHVDGHRFSSPDGGEIVFVPDAAGAFTHIFMGLYSARRKR